MARSHSPTPNYSLRSASNSSRSGSEDAQSRPPTADPQPYSPYLPEHYGSRTLSPPPNSATYSAAPERAMRDPGSDQGDGASDQEAPLAIPGQMPRSDDEERSPEEETEAGSGTQHGPSVQEARKKRTRTLTTPYQSAVLHALLAQSRFPTTQMREEVGRAIGLSARKVQIWFQNQRQKAKRNAQSQTVTTTAPAGAMALLQYGPFTQGLGLHGLMSSAEASSPASLEPTLGGPSGQLARGMFMPDPSGSLPGRQLPPRSQPPFSDPYPRPSSSGSQLAGPGIPGAGPTLPPLPEDISYQASGLPAFVDPYYDSPSAAFSGSLSRHSTSSSHSSWRRRRGSSSAGMRDFHPVLPPLVIDDRATSSAPSSAPRSASRNIPMSSGLALSAPPSSTSFDFAHSLPPPIGDNPFAHRLPDLPAQLHPPLGPGASAQLGLPPPFTLEPPPQWDHASYHPFLRPSSSSSMPPSRRAEDSLSLRSLGSYSPLRERASWDPREPSIVPRARYARYDPVRSSTDAGAPGPSSYRFRDRGRPKAWSVSSEDDADDEAPSPRFPHRRPPH